MASLRRTAAEIGRVEPKIQAESPQIHPQFLCILLTGEFRNTGPVNIGRQLWRGDDRVLPSPGAEVNEFNYRIARQG